MGFDSLQINFRGHGNSSDTSLDFTIVGQMLDAQAALEYLSSKYDLGKITISVVGCSCGSPPALFAAARNSDIVRRLTLICPVLSYERTFLKPETKWGQKRFNERTLADMKRMKVLPFSDDFSVGIRLVEEMKLIRPDPTWHFEALSRMRSSCAAKRTPKWPTK